MAEYAHPEYLVETDWVAAHLNDPQIRIAESDEDYLLYETGHIAGAVKVDWFTLLQDPVRRDFLSKEAFEQMCASLGIGNDTTVVFYGDKNNWFAAYSLWLFEYFGHKKSKIMNGGRAKWERENRPLSKDAPSHPKTTYHASGADANIRAFRDEVMKQHDAKKPLVDVRSPKEYSGEQLHMPGYAQEGAQRGGHIPGAVSIPWGSTIKEDNTFKPADELKAIYEGKGIKPDEEIIAYCRIGERSAHTWFVLTKLLGYPKVKNYDGSWTEWGNLVNAPVQKDYKG